MYYRLNQKDFSGASTLSNIVVIDYTTQVSAGSVQSVFFPNPFEREVTLSINSPSASQTLIEVYDITGQLILSESKTLTVGHNIMVLQGTELLQSGVHFVKCTTNGVRQTEKLIKKTIHQ